MLWLLKYHSWLLTCNVYSKNTCYIHTTEKGFNMSLELFCEISSELPANHFAVLHNRNSSITDTHRFIQIICEMKTIVRLSSFWRRISSSCISVRIERIERRKCFVHQQNIGVRKLEHERAKPTRCFIPQTTHLGKIRMQRPGPTP